MKRYKRRTKLIHPKLQLTLIGTFGGIALLAMLMQFLLLGYFLTKSVSQLDNGGQLAAQVPGALMTVLGISLLVLTPVFLVIGIMLTFRFAGPVYRFEQFLMALSRGEAKAPCKIREGDHLQSLCDAINVATEPLIRQARENESKTVSGGSQAAA